MKAELDSMAGTTGNMVSLIGECLDDLADKIDQRKPVPGYIWDWLGRIDTMSSLADKVILLKSFINT